MNSSEAQLDSLDDSTLLLVLRHLNPFPDRFNCALCSRRLRDLALDRRSWLFVTHTAAASDAASPEVAHQRQCRRSLQAAPSSASLGSAAAAAASGGAGMDREGEEGQHCHWYRSQYATLEAALAASRPGDTILLEAGPEPHLVASPLVVPHPVHILGGGAEVGECVVEGARGIEALLDFRASGRVANLTLRATAGACVAHTRGRLTVQGCTLECDARGLPHLAAPLLTRAVSGAPPQPATPAGLPGGKEHLSPFPSASHAALGRVGPALAAAAAAAGKLAPPVRLQPAAGQKRAAAAAAAVAAAPAKRQCVWLAGAGASAAGAGVLRVVETRIKAQGLAVDLRGSGRLAGVRAIYSTGHALIWLEVDSANSQAPGASGGSGSSGSGFQMAAAPLTAPAAGASSQSAAHLPPLLQGGGSSGASGASVAACPAGTPAGAPGAPLPSWLATAAAAGFDAAAFQRKAQILAAAGGTEPTSGPQQRQQGVDQGVPADVAGAGASLSLDQKAEAWCALHHSSLAAAAPDEVAVAAPAAPAAMHE